jgi:hypothetical protein
MAMSIVLVVSVAAIVAGVYALHCLLLWMERRGWIHYRKRRFRDRSSGGGATAGVLSSFQQFVEPEIRYVMEEKDQRKAESDTATPSDR